MSDCIHDWTAPRLLDVSGTQASMCRVCGERKVSWRAVRTRATWDNGEPAGYRNADGTWEVA